MTVTIGTLRSGIATNLATISGLRTSATVPDAPTPPQAVVIPSTITYDRAFHRGLDQYEFVVTVIVGRASDRNAQASIDAYCNPTGASSIKTAIESDRTLGGIAQSLHVTEMLSYASTSIGDTIYLTADFSVTVYA